MNYQPQAALPNAPNAVLALVLGIISIVLCSVTGPFAWWLGQQAEQAVDASGGTLGGRGMATAGKILGIIGTVLLGIAILAGIIILIVAVASPSN
jgi:hypothetical protein